MGRRSMTVAVQLLCCAVVVAVAVAVPAGPFAAQVDVLTYHNDAARTGQNVNETILTPAAVSQPTFGRVFTRVVDGAVYAQPLVVSGLQIPNRGTHDVVFVATENDTVYAFDATGTPRSALWRRRLVVPGTGGRPVPAKDTRCEDLTPKVGVTSTPVIDRASNTLYAVARTKERGVGNYVQRLHALDLATGAEKLGGPVVIAASVPGTGDGANEGGTIDFRPLEQHQRAALTLANGVVYIGWASLCDVGPYHGWVMAYDATTLAQLGVFNTTPNGGLGGVWQSGAGPAADAAGNIYFETGNGTFDAQTGGSDYGDTLVKLTLGADLTVADYFTPFNQEDLFTADTDLGSGGTLLLPDQSGPHPHVALASGKEGTIYVVDRDAMGHFHPGDDSQIVQVLRNAVGGTWSMPAFWNDTVYYLGSDDHLKAFAVSSGLLSASAVSEATDVFGFPGATPSVSANGTDGGIVWALQTDGFDKKQPAILRAYDAGDLTQALFASDRSRRDAAGRAVKFAVPTVANGRVYVGGQNRLTAYGIH